LFCFETVEKTKEKDHLRSTSSSHQRSRLKNNNKRLLFLPSSRISSTTTHTFAENNEPFFLCGALSRRAKRSSFGGELDALGIYTECGGDLV